MFRKNESSKDKPENDMSAFESSFNKVSSNSDEDTDFASEMSELLTRALHEDVKEGVVVSKWIVVAEVIDSDGANLISTASESVSAWDFVGMLKTETAVAESGYSAAVLSTYCDHSDEDDD